MGFPTAVKILNNDDIIGTFVILWMILILGSGTGTEVLKHEISKSGRVKDYLVDG